MLVGTQVCRSLKCRYFGAEKRASLTFYGFFVARLYQVSSIRRPLARESMPS